MSAAIPGGRSEFENLIAKWRKDIEYLMPAVDVSDTARVRVLELRMCVNQLSALLTAAGSAPVPDLEALMQDFEDWLHRGDGSPIGVMQRWKHLRAALTFRGVTRSQDSDSRCACGHKRSRHGVVKAAVCYECTCGGFMAMFIDPKSELGQQMIRESASEQPTTQGDPPFDEIEHLLKSMNLIASEVAFARHDHGYRNDEKWWEAFISRVDTDAQRLRVLVRELRGKS